MAPHGVEIFVNMYHLTLGQQRFLSINRCVYLNSARLYIATTSVHKSSFRPFAGKGVMQVRRSIGRPFLIPQPILIADHKEHITKKVNQYILQEKVGRGAMGKVYLAVDSNTNQTYAAKAVPIRRGSGMLERELNLMRQFSDHPNIVKLHEVLHDRQNATVYLIMEYGDCGSLAGQKDLDDATISKIFKQIAQGLDYLHSRGVVHQDVKPSNIILFSDGSAKLSDFGIGHHFESAEEVFGSPAYQAPEFFADADEELDPVIEEVWSLGVSLFETKFGRLPFEGETVYEIANTIRHGQAFEIPDCSPDLHDLLNGMLNSNPRERFTMEQVLQHPFLNSQNTESEPKLKKRTKKGVPHSGSFDAISASVCQPGYNFACLRQPKSWPDFPH